MNRRSINLLTWRFRFYLLVRARLLQWSVAWGLCAVLMVSWWQLENYGLGTAMDALAVMESRSAPLKQMQSENVLLAKRVKELNSHQSLLTRLDDEQIPYRLLGLVSRKIADCAGTIRIDSLSFESRREPEPVSLSAVKSEAAAKTGSKTPAEPLMRDVTSLTLNGLADDNITVSQFVGLLRDSQVFESVELVSSLGSESETQRNQAYVVKCVL